MVFGLYFSLNHSQRDALSKIYDANKNLMYSIASKILNDSFMAEDALQQAFLRLIKSKSLTKFFEFPCNKQRNFLVIIVRNISYDMYTQRKNQNTVDISENDIVCSDDPVDYVLSEEIFSEINGAFKQLASVQKDTLILHYVYEHSIKEIAELTGASEGNVRIRLHRARKKLAELLRKGEEHE